MVLCCAAAGVQVVKPDDLPFAQRLLDGRRRERGAAEGVAGLGVMDDGQPLAGTGAVGIGALAIGNVNARPSTGCWCRDA